MVVCINMALFTVYFRPGYIKGKKFYAEVPKCFDLCGWIFKNTATDVINPEISKKIVVGKIKNAVGTGAQSWATGCPGCRVQLSGNLPQKGMLDVCHPMEIIARGLKEPGKTDE
ncbi:hypothetical protein [uncultured Desulfobacter sp.]|uniref:hypothetical protein n=1 Tax=uncultured Desulfobacter sp. TaxID=240139 RepID=UPI00374A6069